MSAHPDRILSCDFLGKVEHLLHPPSGYQYCKRKRSNIRDELSPLKFGFKKILPGIGHLIFRDELLIVGNNAWFTGKEYGISRLRIHHLRRYRKDVLLRHATQVELF